MTLEFNKSYRILVVDDVPKNIQVIGTILREKGLLVSVAQDGKQALEVVKQDPPDLILMDVMMPEMDGFEACQLLKKNESSKDIPIIFLSGLTDTMNKVQGFSFGAVDYVTKPIESDELLARIHSHLTIQSLTKELEETNLNLEKLVQNRTAELEQRNQDLHKSEQQYRELQNNVPVGVYRSATDGRFISVNKAMVSILGYNSIEELLNTSITEIYANPVDRKRLIEKLNQSDVIIGEEIRVKRKDETPIWISFSTKAIFDENKELKYYDGIIEDITFRIKSKEQLLKAKERAEESDRLKTAFLATMSHELRTPLNSIIGFSDVLRNDINNSGVKDFARIINSSGNHLLGMIEEIFNLSMIESDEVKLSYVETNLNNLLNDLYVFIQEEAKSKNKDTLSINCHIDEQNNNFILNTDEDKLKQIFIVLLKNAVKFTNEGLIEFGVREIKEADIIFFVKDTGIGISEDKIEIVFDNFRQADDSNTRLYGGLGIGLSIASKLIELLKGKMWVKSEINSGSEFCFSVPYNDCSVRGDKKSVELDDWLEIRFPGKKILVVEDELFNYQYLESVLSKTGVELLWAENGEKAVQITQSNPDIDMILMDMKMPVMDGYTAAKQIRDFNTGVPIIAQTAYSVPYEDDMNVYINESITKPIKIKNLYRLIHKYFNSN